MFKRKKNATVVSQEQKVVISLSSDVWSDILRHFTRKQLCQQIHLVNRQLYDLAKTRHNVPNIHVIYKMVFKTAERPLIFANFFKSRRFNGVRFGDYDSKDLETHQLRKMPIPEPYVRFRKVYIFRLLGESTLKFLCDAKESFVGSAIHFPMIHILDFDIQDMRNQMHYLFQHVFQKISYISVHGECQRRLSELIAFTDGLPNCSRMKINFRSLGTISDEDAIRMLLDWLSSGKGARNLQSDIGKKHLILDRFPRRFILDMVQQFKDAFNVENRPFSDFVITFVASAENYTCLEGDHTFNMDRISSNERLSFFTHNEFACSEPGSGRVYRLWCRRVVNEPEDLKMASHLQNLEDWFSLGIDLDDHDFYHFNYPCVHEYGFV
ncbi:hypothetical protein Ddc_19537 [Ditylenchus destructor]|nr:hypothetical protein Ddc_19537 [Ditylenchus destructor]